MTTPSNGNEPADGLYKFVEYELNFQRTRKQEIFSWASSLLVAMIGGVIAVTAAQGVMLEPAHRWLLSFAVVILCGFSCYWIKVHWAGYLRARKKLRFYYDQIAAPDKDHYWRYDYTSMAAIVALALVALVSVWWPVWWPITSRPHR
jgi:branched-subunit amino acid ABC-type transport system permease component